MGGRAAQALGAWGESIVARHLGYQRQPGSGNRWPRQQDLFDDSRRRGDGIGLAPRRLAQVKTTRAQGLVQTWLSLMGHAVAEGADPYLYTVVVTDHGQTAMIFQTTLVKTIALGIGGDE